MELVLPLMPVARAVRARLKLAHVPLESFLILSVGRLVLFNLNEPSCASSSISSCIPGSSGPYWSLDEWSGSK